MALGHEALVFGRSSGKCTGARLLVACGRCRREARGGEVGGEEGKEEAWAWWPGQEAAMDREEACGSRGDRATGAGWWVDFWMGEDPEVGGNQVELAAAAVGQDP